MMMMSGERGGERCCASDRRRCAWVKFMVSSFLRLVSNLEQSKIIDIDEKGGRAVQFMRPKKVQY